MAPTELKRVPANLGDMILAGRYLRTVIGYVGERIVTPRGYGRCVRTLNVSVRSVGKTCQQSRLEYSRNSVLRMSNYVHL